MSQSQTTKPLPGALKTPSKGLARWETIRKVLTQLTAKLGFRLEIENADEAAQTGDGLRFKLRPGTLASDHPWKGVTRSGLTCLGGMVNSIEIGDTVVATGEGWCYLELNFTLDVEDGYVYSSALVSAYVRRGLTVPGDSGNTFYMGLFRVSSSGSITQSASRNIIVSACDDGSGTSSARLNVMQS